VSVRLFDADGRDGEVELRPGMVESLDDRQLLWIDIADREHADLDAAGAAVGLEGQQAARLRRSPKRVDLTQFPDHIHLALEALEAPAEGDDPEGDPVRQSVDVLAGRNWVVTVHDGALAAIERLDALTEGETKLGALNAAGFLAAIADEVLAGYFERIEKIEREIDLLDEQALRSRPNNDLLVRIVALRRRIGLIRRTLAPHRSAFAALARPEMELHEELGRPWPGLIDRLERALDSVENVRDLLLGTFDIHMGRAAQDANDVMKRLTLLSAILLPSVVLAGVMGMNFKLSIFDDPNNFWLVVGAMVTFAVATAVVARRRHWV
jgi:magnesium transporter